jgi:hypothetical protein
MNAPFNPDRLSPSASLNRVRIVDLPGVALEASVKGKTAYELLSAQALTDYVREHAAALGLDAGLSGAAALPVAFDRRFEADSKAIRGAAEEAARHFGRRLGYLILALKRGDAANRQAREEWDDTYWAHWASIREIWLGGGLVSGHLGERLRQYAQAVLAEAGTLDCALHLSPYSSALPLVGAARCFPPDSQAGLVFDFGHSYIKRACALYESGTLVALRLLSPLATGWTEPAEDPADQSWRWAERMVNVVADTWQAVRTSGLAPAPLMAASIASYVVEGQPAAYDRGIYAQLRAISDNLGRWLSQHAGERVGHPVEISLLHDGTAAARTYAGTARAAVIMLGTALGVGFPPRAGELRPISPAFQVLGAIPSKLSSVQGQV